MSVHLMVLTIPLVGLEDTKHLNCATLDLALQGTTTVQDKCSSGTVINLSPGNYIH